MIYLILFLATLRAPLMIMQIRVCLVSLWIRNWCSSALIGALYHCFKPIICLFMKILLLYGNVNTCSC